MTKALSVLLIDDNPARAEIVESGLQDAGYVSDLRPARTETHTPVEIRRLDMRWHGTILARRPVMLPEITYWARARGAGSHTYLLAGEQPLCAAQQALSAAVRATNPGPWLASESGMGAVISDGRLEVCACFSVSCASVETAIVEGVVTLDAVGAITRAGTNCGSCRPEIRALLRAARLREAA